MQKLQIKNRRQQDESCKNVRAGRSSRGGGAGSKVEDDEALVKVMAVGVCGSDIPRANVYGAHVSPIILGHEFAGQIIQVGKNVTKFKVGDRVTCPPLIPCFECEWCKMGQYSLCEHYDYYGSRRDGAMAEFISVKESNLWKLAIIFPMKTAPRWIPAPTPCTRWHGLSSRRGAVCAFTEPALSDCSPYSTRKSRRRARSSPWISGMKKLEQAKKVGADVVINSKNEDAAAKVKEATGGLGANVVIDFSGVPIGQLTCLHCASKLGRVILLGISHKGLDLSEKEVDLIMREQLDIRVVPELLYQPPSRKRLDRFYRVV